MIKSNIETRGKPKIGSTHANSKYLNMRYTNFNVPQTYVPCCKLHLWQKHRLLSLTYRLLAKNVLLTRYLITCSLIR